MIKIKIKLIAEKIYLELEIFINEEQKKLFMIYEKVSEGFEQFEQNRPSSNYIIHSFMMNNLNFFPSIYYLHLFFKIHTYTHEHTPYHIFSNFNHNLFFPKS